MAQIAPITITDGKDTPVSHTFNPVMLMPVATYRENGIALPLVGEPVLTLGMIENSTYRTAKLKLTVPQLEEANGADASGYVAAPKVAFVDLVNIEFRLANRSVVANRKDMLALAISLLQDSQVSDLVENLAKPY